MKETKELNKNKLTQKKLRYHSNRVATTKEFTFDAAHNLLNYDGKCKKLHGHTYRLAITLSSYLGENGLSIDFSEIKDIYNKAIHSKLDHQYLNDVLPHMNTTAENMIVWIWEEIDNEIKQSKREACDLRIEELRLYETPTSYVTIKYEWMRDR